MSMHATATVLVPISIRPLSVGDRLTSHRALRDAFGGSIAKNSEPLRSLNARVITVTGQEWRDVTFEQRVTGPMRNHEITFVFVRDPRIHVTGAPTMEYVFKGVFMIDNDGEHVRATRIALSTTPDLALAA